jgi:putative flippase GtrA
VEVEMSLKNWTPKVAALAAVGCAITILFMMSISLVWRHQFQAATWRLALGLLLIVVFFRRRRIAFLTIALSFLLVIYGLDVPFHPTVLGIVVTLVSAFLLYSLAVWENRRYPNLKRRDWKVFFDGDPE